MTPRTRLLTLLALLSLPACASPAVSQRPVDAQSTARLELAVPDRIGQGRVTVIRVNAFDAKGHPLDVKDVSWSFSGAIAEAGCPSLHPHSMTSTCSGARETAITGVAGGVGTVTVRVGSVTEVRKVAVAEELAKCEARTRELKSYLSKVFDSSVKTVPAPWPTGDAARDREIEQLRTTMRNLLAAPAPTKLSPGTKPGKLEHALATCKPALDQLVRVSESAPDAAAQTMVEIADAISTCQCSVDVPLVTALLYISQRGPD